MRRATLLSAVALLCACALPSGNREPAWTEASPAPLPGGVLASSAEGTVTVDLPTVMRLSHDRSLDARLVRERVREAYARELSARDRFLPTLFVGARFVGHDGMIQSTEGGFLDLSRQSAFAGGVVALQWEVGDAIYSSLAARQRTEASRAAAEAGESDSALLAAEIYFDLVGAQTGLRIAEESVALAESVAKEVEAKVSAGGGFRGDLLRARAQASHERLRLDAAREAVKRSSLRLAEALDLPADVELRAADPVPVPLALADADTDEATLVASALCDRPELRETSRLRAAAARERDAARLGPLFPTIAADVSFGAFGQTFDDGSGSDDYRVGLGWRFGPGGLFDRGRTRSADARLRIAEMEASRVRARIARDVLESAAAVKLRASSVKSAELAASDAHEALELYRERLKGGIGLPLEVVLAEEGLARAKRDWIEVLVAYDKAQVRLLHALGGGRLAARNPGR